MAKNKKDTSEGAVPQKMPRKKPEQNIGGGAVPPNMPHRPRPKKNTNKKG